MSSRQSPEVREFRQQLKNVPLMLKCRDGLAATERFYAATQCHRAGTHCGAKPKKKAMDGLRRTVRELERLTVAYAPSKQRSALKQVASDFADSMIAIDLGHAPAMYGNAELRIRRLELACLQSNLKHGGPWVVVTNQRGADFEAAVNDWLTFLEGATTA